MSWDDVACVSEARKLMLRWEKLTPTAALVLLDLKYPDPSVRRMSCHAVIDLFRVGWFIR